MVKQCAGPDCDREAWANGLCRAHRRQEREGKPLKPVRNYNFVQGDSKVCPKCDVQKHVDQFYYRADGTMLAYCKECAKAYSVDYQRRHREEYKALLAEKKAREAAENNNKGATT